MSILSVGALAGRGAGPGARWTSHGVVVITSCWSGPAGWTSHVVRSNSHRGQLATLWFSSAMCHGVLWCGGLWSEWVKGCIYVFWLGISLRRNSQESSSELLIGYNNNVVYPPEMLRVDEFIMMHAQCILEQYCIALVWLVRLLYRDQHDFNPTCNKYILHLFLLQIKNRLYYSIPRESIILQSLLRKLLLTPIS